jgi:hypothetical protein
MLKAEGIEINSNREHFDAYRDQLYLDEAEEARQEYFVLPEVFKNEICTGVQHVDSYALIGRARPVDDWGQIRRNPTGAFAGDRQNARVSLPAGSRGNRRVAWNGRCQCTYKARECCGQQIDP